MSELQLKPKQTQTIQIINTQPEIDEIVLIGAVGTGKTVVASHIIISICYSFSDTRWFAWRKNNTVSRKTLVRTFKKTLVQMNLVEGADWTWHDMAMEFRFPHNGSSITFSEADRSKDKDQMKIKGIDATGNLIDEANELEEDSFDMILSRKGRANENGQPSVNLITMNPNNGWSKRRYYDKWKKGILPDNVVVIEYTIDDSWQEKNDIAALFRKAKWWVERYLRNNWNYADEDQSLITSYIWEKSQIYDLPPIEPNQPFKKYIGVDPSDAGSDTTVATLIDNGVMVAQKELKIPEREFGEDSEKDQRPISHLYTNELIKFAQQHGFTARYASNIMIEENGIGVGMRDDLRKRSWQISIYHATNQSRNEIYLGLRRSMDNGDLKIHYRDDEKYDDNTLQRQLFAHTTDIKNEQEVVCPKSDVKAELGISPDKADSLAIANYAANGSSDADPSQNQNRISL